MHASFSNPDRKTGEIMEPEVNHHPVTPSSEKERIDSIDMLRGFALFGVLLVNTQMFNDTLHTFSGNPFSYEGTDQTVALLIQIFATGKFYTLFSFLFGLGFYLFTYRLAEKGIDPLPVFRRRLFYLFVFGLFHMIFFWYGDILTGYTIGGFVLMLFYRQPARQVRAWSLAILTASMILLAWLVSAPTMNPGLMTPQAYEVYQQSLQRYVTQYREGSYPATVIFRMQREIPLVFMNFLVWIPKLVGIFLAGFYAGKIHFFEKSSQYINRLKVARVVSGLLGLLLTGLYLWVGSTRGGALTSIMSQRQAYFVAELSKELATVMVALFYLSFLMLLWHNPAWQKKLSVLVPMGRMAFTHYLAQSLVLTTIFYGHGLGLMHKISLAQGVAITLVIYVIQVVLSHYFLQRFRQGPMEALWRRGTYGGKRLTERGTTP